MNLSNATDLELVKELSGRLGIGIPINNQKILEEGVVKERVNISSFYSTLMRTDFDKYGRCKEFTITDHR